MWCLDLCIYQRMVFLIFLKLRYTLDAYPCVHIHKLVVWVVGYKGDFAYQVL